MTVANLQFNQKKLSMVFCVNGKKKKKKKTFHLWRISFLIDSDMRIFCGSNMDMKQDHCTVDVEIRLFVGDDLCWQVVVCSPG